MLLFALPVLLMTYNLRRNTVALDLVLSHLAGVKESFIASFQELPAAEARTTARARTYVKRLGLAQPPACLGVVPSAREHGRVGLFCSADVAASARDPDVAFDINRRMAVSHLRVGAGR